VTDQNSQRVDFDAVETPWFLKKASLLTAGAAFALVAVSLMMWRHSRNHGPQAPDLPLVTVTVPGQSSYALSVNFTGAIIARYDVPIGVEGEGGRVLSLHAEAGDVVKRGQILARLDTAVLGPQVASLRAALEQARADAELAMADYHRAQKIADSVGALSKEEVERRHTLAMTTAARGRTAEAQLAEAEARLRRTDIVAPEDGIVLTRSAEIGQAMTAGSPALFRMARGGEVEMKAQVAEQDLPKLQVGQDVSVTVTGVQNPFAGKVRLLAAVIDPMSRLAEVRITLPKDPLLRPGAFAHGTAVVGHDQRPLVPQTALLTDSGGSYVLVVGSDNKVVRRGVRYGDAQSGGVAILEGLTGDERVVATAGAFLKEGEAVRVVERGKSTP
jgi:RND family efflux transporter MFP subunit